MTETKKQTRAKMPPEARKIADLCRALVESAQDSICVVDRRCLYIYANLRYAAHLGASPDTLTGKSHANYHASEEAAEFARIVACVFEKGKPFRREHQSSRDGCKYLQTFTPIFDSADGGKKVIAASVNSRNMTRWKLAQSLYSTLMDKSPIGIFIVQNGRYVWINRRFQENTGYTPKEILGADSLFPVHPEDRDFVRRSARAMMNARSIIPYEYRLVTKAGETLWYMGTVTSIEYKGKPATLGSQMDVTLLKQTEDALRQSEDRSRSIVDNIADAYYEVDLRGNLLFFNEAYLKLFGYRRGEMLGLNFRRYVDKKHVDLARRTFAQVYKTGKPIKRMAWEIINKNGETRQVELSVSLVRDAQGKPSGFRGIASDITLRRREEEAMRNQAFHDPLTGLSNRILFYDRLNMAMKRARRSQKRVGVIVIDLDHFKDVNDRWGHVAGDALLQEVGERLSTIVRDTDTVSRQGGDEFNIVLPSVNSPHDVIQIAEKIVEAFHRPVHLDTGAVTVTTSVGVAVYPEDGEDPDTLVQKADKAMYRAKNLGRNRYCSYEESGKDKGNNGPA